MFGLLHIRVLEGERSRPVVWVKTSPIGRSIDGLTPGRTNDAPGLELPEGRSDARWSRDVPGRPLTPPGRARPQGEPLCRVVARRGAAGGGQVHRGRGHGPDSPRTDPELRPELRK